jgi:hypothetical protein
MLQFPWYRFSMKKALHIRHKLLRDFVGRNRNVSARNETLATLENSTDLASPRPSLRKLPHTSLKAAETAIQLHSKQNQKLYFL